MKNIKIFLVSLLCTPFLFSKSLIYSQTTFTSHYILDPEATINRNASSNLANGGTIDLVYNCKSGDTSIPELGNSFTIPVTFQKMTPINSAAINKWSSLSSRVINNKNYLVLNITTGTGTWKEAPLTTGSIYSNLPSTNIKNQEMALPSYGSNQVTAFEYWLLNGYLTSVGTTSINVGNTPSVSSAYVTKADSDIVTRSATGNWTTNGTVSTSGFYIKPSSTNNPSGTAMDYPFSYGSSVNFTYTAYYYKDPNPAQMVASNTPLDNNIGLSIAGSITYKYYNPSVLPVKLGDFKGILDGKEVMLNWNTLTENNNRRFEILKSMDSKYWNTIGTVESKALDGNSSNSLFYAFIDNNPFIGINYYQLRQVDLDGHFNTSNVISIINNNGNMTLPKVRLYPNPAFSSINIDNIQIGSHIRILGMDGKVYLELSASTIPQSINISSLTSGIYIVQTLENNKVTNSAKFFKQ